MTLKGKGPKDEKPRDVGTDQAAGYHAGENFAPRNRGEVSDAQDRGAAALSGELARKAREDEENPGTIAQTSWEDRVERGEEWTTEDTPEREARGEEEANSETSRRGLVSPPPEE
jgi:hypothetical protein